MVLPFKGAQKHLQKGVCQNWTFTGGYQMENK